MGDASLERHLNISLMRLQTWPSSVRGVDFAAAKKNAVPIVHCSFIEESEALRRHLRRKEIQVSYFSGLVDVPIVDMSVRPHSII